VVVAVVPDFLIPPHIPKILCSLHP
jgi:hypothetical protein